MSIPLPLAATLLALTPLLAAGSQPSTRMEIAQLTIHQRIIIRIPRYDMAGSADPKPQRWVEKAGPKCVPMSTIQGAVVSAADTVDLLTENNQRVRAKLDADCPTLDYYSGFYLRGTPDGMICAARDSFRSRSGGVCRIAAFRALRPRRWLDNLPLIRKR